MKKHNQFAVNLFDSTVTKELNQIEKSENEKTWSKAYSEVYQVLQYSKAIFKKIPQSFIMFLSENMDRNWTGQMDSTRELDSMELLDETRIMLSLIYRDFICTEEKRKELVDAERLAAENTGLEYDDQSLRDLFTD